MTEESKTKLREKILRSRELTAMEKRYLEELVNHQRDGQWMSMPMNELTDYQKCLKSICEYDATIPGPCSYCGDVYPCTWIAKDTGISVYKVRKIMKQLETDGYVDKDSFGGYDDWNDRIYCIHGYKVTEKSYCVGLLEKQTQTG